MNEPQCIITGCDLLDLNRHATLHGDLFVFDGTFIFNAACDANNVPHPWLFEEPGARHVRVSRFFERRGVVVFRAQKSLLSTEARSYIGGEWE